MKNERIRIHPGTTTLIMIMTVMALVIFAVLSFSSSNIYQKQIDELEKRQEEYYGAEEKASQILEKLSQYLRKAAENASEDEFFDSLEETVKDLPEITLQADSFSFEVPSGEGQKLKVCVTAHFPENAEELPYRIVEWKLENTEEWNGNDSRTLLGESERS